MAPTPHKGKKGGSSSTTKPLSFPDGESSFKTARNHSHYDELLAKTFVCAPSLCPSTLSEVNIKEEVESFLSVWKLSVLAEHHEVSQYEYPTREFVSSFEDYMDDSGVGWKFQLGGISFKKSKEEICALFKLSLGGWNGECSMEERDEFWKEISRMDNYILLMIPKNIKGRVWKYIHRLVSMSLD